jgi:hypothetical protein
MGNPDKFWETVHSQNFPWSQVVSGYWCRYPNPNSGHVFAEDMVECAVSAGNGVLRAKRVIYKTNKLPSWGEHLFSTRKVVMVEEIEVDPAAKTMVTYTREGGIQYI